MGYRGGGAPQLQIAPLSPVVKILMIVTVAVWFVGNVVIEQYILSDRFISTYLGLVPIDVIKNFYLWQPITYMFVHAVGPLHVLFNMLLLWWLGSDLERYWGSRFFTTYYFVCGIGAALLYCLVVGIYSIVSGNMLPVLVPVVGASGAVFGLMVAYGLIYGERVFYFMLFFPMKAKYFVVILACVEVVLVLNNGLGKGDVANLAHLGGLITGFVFLIIWPRIKGGFKAPKRSKKSNNLRLVVNNSDKEVDNPKYWN